MTTLAKKKKNTLKIFEKQIRKNHQTAEKIHDLNKKIQK